MTSAIEILGADTLQRLPQVTSGAERSVRYTRAIVQDGARSYVDNADVEMKALVVDGKVLPLVLAKAGGENSNVCSPYSHYVRYLAAERAMRHPRIPPFLFDAAGLPAGLTLKLGGIERVVYVNNWLLGTNPSPGLSSDQITRLTATLATTYPRSAIVFRSVNPRLDPSGFVALQRNGYRLVRSRWVYVLDPTSGRHLARTNVRMDLELLRRTSYDVVGSSKDLEPHVARITTLYRDLYVRKYPDLNPQFNTRFFALTLRDEVFTYRALTNDGRLDAFTSYFIEGGVLTGVVIGHDRQLPRTLGLYRMVVAILIAEAAARGLLLNISAGADQYKMLRGARPVDEFDAVYERHLPWPRRFTWAALAIASNRHLIGDRPKEASAAAVS
ncbi:MAG: GNAT family N-acetyltransferase [Deltaproteobacteria bacterium]|nr:GNAT family N-acetyltransferase [Deltaproteobacteria bacterium]